jgi:hypothetical protein
VLELRTVFEPCVVKNYIARKCELSDEHPQMSANNLKFKFFSSLTDKSTRE